MLQCLFSFSSFSRISSLCGNPVTITLYIGLLSWRSDVALWCPGMATRAAHPPKKQLQLWSGTVCPRQASGELFAIDNRRAQTIYRPGYQY